MKSFDERSVEYSKRTNLNPSTYKGDVDTAYATACSEQYEIDRATYTPCINFLLQAVENMARLLKENGQRKYSPGATNIYIAADRWIEGVDVQLAKIPYDMRRLPSGTFMQTDDEKEAYKA